MKTQWLLPDVNYFCIQVCFFCIRPEMLLIFCLFWRVTSASLQIQQVFLQTLQAAMAVIVLLTHRCCWRLADQPLLIFMNWAPLPSEKSNSHVVFTCLSTTENLINSFCQKQLQLVLLLVLFVKRKTAFFILWKVLVFCFSFQKPCSNTGQYFLCMSFKELKQGKKKKKAC